MFVKSRLCLLAVALAVIPLASCSKGNKNANAHVVGKVTYKGAPVTGGLIFIFAENSGLTTVTLKPDGTFEGTSLPIGEVIASIDTEALNPNKKKAQYGGGAGGGGGPGAGGVSPMPEGAAKGTPGTYVQIPAKYADRLTSPLKKTLTSGKQTWDMELTD